VEEPISKNQEPRTKNQNAKWDKLGSWNLDLGSSASGMGSWNLVLGIWLLEFVGVDSCECPGKVRLVELGAGRRGRSADRVIRSNCTEAPAEACTALSR
jgi:hypothetical protein